MDSLAVSCHGWNLMNESYKEFRICTRPRERRDIVACSIYGCKTNEISVYSTI